MIVTYNDLGKQQDKVDLLSRIFIEEEKDAENEEVKD